MLEDAVNVAPTLSWAQRCVDLGRPRTWTDIDRAEVAQLAAR